MEQQAPIHKKVEILIVDAGIQPMYELNSIQFYFVFYNLAQYLRVCIFFRKCKE